MFKKLNFYFVYFIVCVYTPSYLFVRGTSVEQFVFSMLLFGFGLFVAYLVTNRKLVEKISRLI